MKIVATLRTGAGGAVSVSGPVYRLTVASFPSVVEKLCAEAAEISNRIGYFGN